jgi:anaerobic selenocysteine-containing dehydrogenase
MAEVALRHGAESIGVSCQVPGTGYIQKGAMMRLASMFGLSVLHAYPMNGDLPLFWPMTFGVQTEELESRQWLKSDYIAVFGSNILLTRLPDAKFLGQAKALGAKVLVIDPIKSQTAAMADKWLQINPDSDTALALGIAREIIVQETYDARFIKAFTDLPLLVRLDTQKRVLAKEVLGLAQEAKRVPRPRLPGQEIHVVFDRKRHCLTLHHPDVVGGELDPALKGVFEVQLITGERILAKPAFELLNEHLKAYTPEAVAQEIAPFPGRLEAYAAIVKRLAQEISRTKSLTIILGAGGYQWYHGDLKGRSLALITALTGNLGKPGAGISTYSGQHKIKWPLASWWGFQGRRPNYASFLLWLNDPQNQTHVQKALPQNGIRALIFGWGNPFIQHDLAGKLTEAARSGALELIVALDFQMTPSCQWADVILPVPTWYEKTDMVATPLHSYLQLQNPAIEPMFEAMPEVWIFKELALRFGQKLGVQGAESFWLTPSDRPQAKGKGDAENSLPQERRLADQAARDAIVSTLKEGGKLTLGITLERLTRGPVALKGGETPPFDEQIRLKKPFPPSSGWPYSRKQAAQVLKTGRMEFYKDEGVFLELGEALPVFKPPYLDTLIP